MTDKLLESICSTVPVLWGSIGTLIANAYVERIRNKSKIQANNFQFKRENLSDIYIKLVSIINLYPTLSPSDVLEYVEFPPNYSMENFDIMLKSLDYRIEDYKKQLGMTNIDVEHRVEIDEKISNAVSAKKSIAEIRDEYYVAKDKYKLFCKSDKETFDLYAGQTVKNCLTNFEVIIHNVFISGRKTGENDSPKRNAIWLARERLVSSMKEDLWIDL